MVTVVSYLVTVHQQNREAILENEPAAVWYCEKPYPQV